MNRDSSRWLFLNPLEWLKSLYETFGVKHPAVSLVIVMIIGAGAFGAMWKVGEHQYEKALAVAKAAAGSQPAPPVGPITTNAPCDPVTLGSGNAVTTNCEPSKGAAPKDAK
jgi:hypothetical protein